MEQDISLLNANTFTGPPGKKDIAEANEMDMQEEKDDIKNDINITTK